MSESSPVPRSQIAPVSQLMDNVSFEWPTSVVATAIRSIAIAAALTPAFAPDLTNAWEHPGW